VERFSKIKIILTFFVSFFAANSLPEKFNDQEVVATLFNPAAKVGRKVLISKDFKIASFPYVNVSKESVMSCVPRLVSFGVFSAAKPPVETITVQADSSKITVSHSQLLTSIVREIDSKVFEILISPNYSALRVGSVIRETVLIKSNNKSCSVNVAGFFN